MSKAKRHTHKYHRVTLGTVTVMACALSDCTHYQPAHSTPLLNGKKSICWSCEDEFILDPLAMEMIKPECAKCRVGISSEPPVSEELTELLNEKL